MIYIDITDTIRIPYITGIQRVVRNLIINSFNDELVSFVEFDRILQSYIIISKNDPRFDVIMRFEIELKKKSIPYKVVKHFFSKNMKYLINKILHKVVIYFRFTLRNIGFNKRFKLVDEIKSGDTLFLADSSWNYHPWIEVNKVKKKGVKIKHIVYDVLPIMYPSYFETQTKFMFNLWFRMIHYFGDEFFAISQTTANNFSKNIQKGYLVENCIKVMHLGSDIEKFNFNVSYSKKKSNVIKFLTVGTIEPRKNHKFVLSVFDKLWRSENSEVEWHIVGKVGWKSNELIEIMKWHPLLNKNLFIYHDLDDTELNKLYAKSDCIIVPSIDEGYGLQIVEAIHNNCNALVSDIEVFKEFNLSNDCYFSIKDNGEELRSKIIQVYFE